MADTNDKEDFKFQTAKDSKGKIIFFSGPEDEGKFQQDMTDWGKQNKYGPVIHTTDKYMPREPRAAYRNRARERDNHHDRKDIEHYEYALEKWETKCHQFLTAFLAALSDDIVRMRFQHTKKGHGRIFAP